MEIAGIKLDELEFENIGSWPLLLRGLVIIITCIVTFYLGYVLELDDKITTLNAAKEKVTQAKNRFFDAQQKVSNLTAYKNDVDTVWEQLHKLTEQLPMTNEEAGLLEDVSQQAVNNGLQFIVIKPGTQEDKEFYHSNPVELELSGNYNGFGEFVSKVSSMKRIITLHDFSIKKNDTQGKGALMMTVLARTYWMSESDTNAKP